MKARLALSIIAIHFLMAVPSAVAAALTVPVGCDAPAALAGRKFYVDPVRGSAANDGSSDHPWRTLSEVLDTNRHLVATRSYTRISNSLGPVASINPVGPIKPGDTIVLMSGDHGVVEASGYVNDRFITVESGKGQIPIVRSLRLISSSHWIFQGIKFQGERKDGGYDRALVSVEGHSWRGPSDNFIFVGGSFSATDDTSAWSGQDWVDKPHGVALFGGAQCLTVTNNHFVNIINAVIVSGDRSLVERNLIENFGNDGIDVVASDVVIRGNRIQNSRHTREQLAHADGIQGWTAPEKPIAT